MLKRICCAAIAACIGISMAICLPSCGKKSDALYIMGDVNGDGAVDENDVNALKSVLNQDEGAQINYSCADLDDSGAVGQDDLDMLEKLVNGEKVKIKASPFDREDTDITASLEDLGINNITYWRDDSTALVSSRNPYDMTVSYGRVLVSGGNYQDNTGPVPINAYQNGSDSAVMSGLLHTEQVNKFYSYDGYTYAMAIDPKDYANGDIYFIMPGESKWTSRIGIIPQNIHCYDMILHNDTYFFCGSGVTNISTEDGWLELSKATIYSYYGYPSESLGSSDIKELQIIGKDGNEITYESIIAEFTDYSTGTLKKTSAGVPRFYEFFELNGELYALYYNQYTKFYGEEYNFNGLYKYNDQTEQFVYDATKDISLLDEIFGSNSQDKEKIQHDFEWNSSYYFIGTGLHRTADFVTYEDVTPKGYEDYQARDCIFLNNMAYLLLSRTNDDGTYTNAVLETADFESFRPVLHFDSPLYARSFEFCNGSFYFGLGFTFEYERDENGDVVYENNNPVELLPDEYKQCGKIYRYAYYE